MIRLIISKEARESSLYLYKKIEERLETRKKSILIVPEQYTLETDINFLRSVKYKAVMDAKVLSFSSFASFFMDNYNEGKLEFLNKEGKVLLLTNILQDLKDDLDLFENSYQNIDFINSLVGLISAFKDNNFDEDFFKAVSESDVSEISKIKFEEIKLILDTYQKEIEGKYLDKEDILYFVAENIGKTDLLDGYEIFIDKFDFFEERKLDLISALYEKGLDINVSLNINPKYINNPLIRPEIFDSPARNFDLFREGFETEIISLESSPRAADLDHLRDNFEKYQPNIYEENPQNIRIYESISTKSEVANIALLINKIIKTNPDIRFKDMAIYLTDTDQYENELIKTFARYEIPIFLDKRRKMADNHIIKTFLALLRLRVNNFRSEDLFYILNSKLIGITEEDADTLINFLTYRKIKGSMFEKDKYFAMDEDFYQKNLATDPKKDIKIAKKREEYNVVNQVRSRILNLIDGLDEKNLTVKNLATKIYKMISDPGIKAGINDFQDKLLANGALDDYKENEQIWDEFIGILDQLVILMGERTMPLSRVYSLIESVAKDVQIGLIPPSKDHLIVTDFARDRVSNKKINILMGMDDSYFPSQEAKDYLISPDEAEDLEEAQIDLKLYAKDRDRAELLSLYKITSRSDKLILSYALSDKEGKDLSESLVIRDIRKIFPGLKKNILLDTRANDALFAKESLKKYTLGVLNKIKNKEKLSRQDKDLAIAFMEYLRETPLDLENKEIYDKIKKGLFYNNDKRPLDPSIREVLYKKHAYSVSEIETYSACPYKHFVAYGLRPDVEKEFDVDAMDIGNIVHKSFEDLSKLIKDMDLDEVDFEEIDQLLDDKFREGIDENLDKERKDNPKNKYILKNINQAAKRNTRQIIDQLNKGNFKLEYFEEAFDKGGFFDPVYVDEENYLRGRIDRIDMAGNLVRVIDYKTGSKGYNLAAILNGKDLQLIIYMIAVNDDRKNLEPIGAFYISLKDEIESFGDSISDDAKIAASLDKKFALDGILLDKDGKALTLMDRDSDGKKSSIVVGRRNYKISEEDFKNLTAYIKNMVKDLVKDIKAGKINLAPLREDKNKSACTYCDYKGICKFDKTIDTFRFRDFDRSLSLDNLEAKND
ncbi:PD-(D/E)XK nuclease family protein [Anaerococcus degeneri]|uniref:Exodeoxyribonuclease V subunit gamma n=1 Tax=Anaerococcus degeneri TaxID=361500 RepID=A0ABS7YYX7_9FIRM|nr:PD-(D/E)XK nuclease family protein [Anaerococcus degeneri]MBP2014729.1 ATP-dependent helicase/nuclease subunit B [Anaerococcus degeneri]MCA2096940.1 exodeoxyribonuclease V subunit gamma [Anaerococcus degeneri]